MACLVWRASRSKGGAADPCSFLARGRAPPDRGNLGDAPQCFRARFPPPPTWPESRSEAVSLTTGLSKKTDSEVRERAVWLD